jgi:hypothetical protein
VAKQEEWLNKQVAAHPSDPFWQVVGLLQAQLDGLYDGYAAGIAAARAAGQEVELLSRDDVLFMNSNGEQQGYSCQQRRRQAATQQGPCALLWFLWLHHCMQQLSWLTCECANSGYVVRHTGAAVCLGLLSVYCLLLLPAACTGELYDLLDMYEAQEAQHKLYNMKPHELYMHLALQGECADCCSSSCSCWKYSCQLQTVCSLKTHGSCACPQHVLGVLGG